MFLGKYDASHSNRPEPFEPTPQSETYLSQWTEHVRGAYDVVKKSFALY